MIDLTPLDVRKKRGDFRKVLRGYDADEVDSFIEMVAERLEELVKENLTLAERVERLQDQVSQQENREEAVREALVTAQELRRDMRLQARREAELLRREAEGEIEKIIGEAERQLAERQEALAETERMRLRFLKSFRSLLEREMDAVEVEEGRKPLEDTPLEIDFTVKDIEAQVDLSGDLDEDPEGAAETEMEAPSATGSSSEAAATGAEASDGERQPSAQAPDGSSGESRARSETGEAPTEAPVSEAPADELRERSGELSGAEAPPEASAADRVEEVDEEEGEGPLLLSSFLEDGEEERSGGDDAR